MAGIRQSFSWWSFAGETLPPERLVRLAAGIGYAGVELAGPEHWPLIRAHGLEIVSARGHRLIERGLNRREHHDEIEREVRASLELAARWGVRNLICFSGNRDGLDDATGAAVTAEGLARLAGPAEAAGVTLLLELLNSKVDHPDYQADHTAWGAAVCRLVGSPRVKLLYDIYHMQVMEGDVVRTVLENHQQIAHYHVAGNPGRHEPDDSQELYYPAIIRAIQATGYQGYLGQEFIPAGDPAAAMAAAYQICNVSSM